MKIPKKKIKQKTISAIVILIAILLIIIIWLVSSGRISKELAEIILGLYAIGIIALQTFTDIEDNDYIDRR